MNNQPPEKKSRASKLQIHSIFQTIQGEGPFCGTSAIFVRLAGCNLQCPLCDTDYTSHREEYSPEELVSKLLRFQNQGLVSTTTKLVVITGGEPFRQDLTELLERLIGAGFYVQIETNGTLPPSQFNYSRTPEHRKGAYIVCSPKTGTIHKKILQYACCLKYVMGHHQVGEDGLPLTALDHTAHPRLARPPADWDRPIYLQPIDWTFGVGSSEAKSLNEESLRACIDSCYRHGYILQLQIHKLIGVP